MGYETFLGLSARGKAMILILLTSAGGLLGWFLPNIAFWIKDIPIVPFKGGLEWVASTDNEWVSIIGASIGAIIGILFSLLIYYEVLHITVSDSEVSMRIRNKTNIFTKDEVTSLFFDGKYVVLLGDKGKELYRGQPEAAKGKVKSTFEQYGYPWAKQDPFQAQYRRWVPDHPDFSPHVNALLQARERALENGEPEKAEELRNDLITSGIIVRDEKKRQYVRQIE